MIEKITNYSLLVRTAANDLTFQKIKSFSDQFILSLPHSVRENLLKELTLGPKLLESEPTMAAFMHSYGDVIEAQLIKAFSKLPGYSFQHDLEIVDYDCGLSLGAMVYHDFLTNANIQQSVRKITLIHSSKICLERAALHAHTFFPNATVNPVYKGLSSLVASDLEAEDELAKLHILTNIHGIDTKTALYLAEIIRESISDGYNYFVTVSPFYGISSESSERVSAFVETLLTDQWTHVHEKLEPNHFVLGKNWTCEFHVFEKYTGIPEYFHKESIPSHADTPIVQLPVAPPIPIEVTPPVPAQTEVEPVLTATPTVEVEPILPIFPKINVESPTLLEPEPKAVQPTIQPSEAFLKVLELAEHGDAKAQNNLGVLYEVGREVQQDDREAVKWYLLAAEQGHAKAQYNLANHYAQGRGVEASEVNAAKWYLQAAIKGIPTAMNNIGTMYATGKGVAKSEAEAVKWYKKAAELGDQTAIRNLQKRGL